MGLWADGPESIGSRALVSAENADFELPDLNGELFRLSSLRGRKVVINIPTSVWIDESGTIVRPGETAPAPPKIGRPTKETATDGRKSALLTSLALLISGLVPSGAGAGSFDAAVAPLLEARYRVTLDAYPYQATSTALHDARREVLHHHVGARLPRRSPTDAPATTSRAISTMPRTVSTRVRGTTAGSLWRSTPTRAGRRLVAISGEDALEDPLFEPPPRPHRRRGEARRGDRPVDGHAAGRASDGASAGHRHRGRRRANDRRVDGLPPS